MTASPRLLVAGFLSIDAIVTADGCGDGLPGGAALYAALGACRAGARVTLAAAVGEDFPPRWLAELTAFGIDVTGVERRPGPTRRARLVHGPADRRLSPHHRDPAWHERTAALPPPLPRTWDGFDAAVAGPMPPALLARLLRGAPCPVVADTSEAFAAADPDTLLALLPGLEVFAPSMAEARLLLPGLDARATALALAARGPRVLLKCGAEGAWAAAGGSAAALAAPPARVVDPTGAGDATVGALAALLAAGVPFEQAAFLALEAGAVAVSALGPAGFGFTLRAALEPCA